MERLAPVWNLSRLNKRLISIFLDSIFVVFSIIAAYWLRLGLFDWVDDPQAYAAVFTTLVVTIVSFIKLGLYRAVLRYVSLHVLSVVVLGAFISAMTLAVSSYFYHAAIPRAVPIIYFTILCIVVGGTRLVIRSLVYQVTSKGKCGILIYGAGSTGRQLALALKPGENYRVVGFIDDDKLLENTVIQGLPVLHPNSLEHQLQYRNVSTILLAIPRASRSERKEVLDSLLKYDVDVKTVPSFGDIVAGRAKVDELKEVAIEDLLGREPVEPNPILMGSNITNKVVMVTGAGGSIGSELCRQIVRQKPSKLILFERSEFSLYQIEKEINVASTDSGVAVDIIPILGSVQHVNRLVKVMSAFDVDTVYHAAAFKHVPLVEYNVIEGVRNNVFGTYYCAKAAIEAGVESFVLISTDKAVRPTNIMGTTKRVAELALQAFAKEEAKKENGTRFCMVRFGNVLGSSGSVIPLFKQQIANGGPITITHADIIRYFMTIPESAQLVIQAGSMGVGGDVFVLDMGDPVKIIDLAKKLVRLSGLELRDSDNPNGDIEIVITGLRPGEKLYEELLIGDNVDKTGHDRIMTANEESLSYAEFEQLLEQLDNACHEFDHQAIRQIFLDAPVDFLPSDGISDLVWSANRGKLSSQ